MKRLMFYLAVFGLLMLSACSGNTQNENRIEASKPTEKEIPRIRLKAVSDIIKNYPASFDNPIQRKDATDSLYSSIHALTGKRIKAVSRIPFKIVDMAETKEDSAFIALGFTDKRQISDGTISRNLDICIRVSSKIPRSVAAKLDMQKSYYIDGIFAGFPPRKELYPALINDFSPTIDLGVWEFRDLILSDSIK